MREVSKPFDDTWIQFGQRASRSARFTTQGYISGTKAPKTAHNE